MAAEICHSKNCCDRYNIALSIRKKYYSTAHRYGNALHPLTSVIRQTTADDIYVNSLLKKKLSTMDDESSLHSPV
jgi:hypothetical protein